jgi:hypothetical protein
MGDWSDGTRKGRAAAALRPLCALLFVVAMLIPDVASEADINGTTFPDKVTLTADGPELILNGAGERRIMFFPVYAIALYLPVRTKSVTDAMAIKGPKRMHMVMLRNEITAKQVHDHLVARIEDGSQPAEMAVMKTRLDDLDRIIDAERVIRLGGSIILDYVPGQGTIIRVNGAKKGEPIPGEDFYNALLRIWLGDRAKSLALRDRLLGRG